MTVDLRYDLRLGREKEKYKSAKIIDGMSKNKHERKSDPPAVLFVFLVFHSFFAWIFSSSFGHPSSVFVVCRFPFDRPQSFYRTRARNMSPHIWSLENLSIDHPIGRTRSFRVFNSLQGFPPGCGRRVIPKVEWKRGETQTRFYEPPGTKYQVHTGK